MNTESLIATLTTDAAARPRRSLARDCWLALIGGAVVAVAMMAATIHPRADFAVVDHEPRFLFKFVVSLALALPAAWLVFRAARPQAKPRLASLMIAPLLLILACAIELYLTQSSTWATRAIGSNAIFCAICVPLLSIAPMIGLFYALSRAAPANARLAGFVAGLCAGGIGAAAYAAHCTDDSPLFVAVWYSMGVVLMGAVGALLGSRYLRW